MIKKTIKLSDDKTVKIIDNEIGNYSITIIKENGYSVDTDKQELKELCKRTISRWNYYY
jgi:DNA polymerase III sliding clamp (beta) subunit (PCNA family)